MKKIGFIILLSALTFSAFGQQFLWSTAKKDGEKLVPPYEVTKEVLVFYDHYDRYYDLTGFSKERFINEIGYGIEAQDLEALNDIKDLTVYAMKSNTGQGSFVLVVCISEDDVNMIIFSNSSIDGIYDYQSTYSSDRGKFARSFKTLLHEAGDAGDPEGTVVSRALYGKSGGGGGGPSLDLAGWRWDYEPNPDYRSKENGCIVFEIKVDDNGEVIGVSTLEKTVSPSVELQYRREVDKLTFSPISGNTIPAPISTGKITFIILSK